MSATRPARRHRSPATMPRHRHVAHPSLLRPLARPLLVLLLTGILAGCVTQTSRQSEIPNAAGGSAAFATGAGRPPSAGTLHALARILATQGRDAECEQVLLRIVRLEPRFAAAYSDLAELYVRRNRLDSAIQTLSFGLDRSPNDPALLNNLGMCQVLTGDYGKAHERFSRAVALAPEDRTYIANHAMALGMLGRTVEAAAAYARVLDSPAAVQENLAVLRHARERAGLGDAGQIAPPGHGAAASAAPPLRSPSSPPPGPPSQPAAMGRPADVP